MIQRVVFVQLTSELQTDTDRELVASHTREVLSGIPMVRQLVVGVPADGRTGREWDLMILLRLDDLEAVEAWRTEKTHRAYVDVYLAPMTAKIRVWNYEIDSSLDFLPELPNPP